MKQPVSRGCVLPTPNSPNWTNTYPILFAGAVCSVIVSYSTLMNRNHRRKSTPSHSLEKVLAHGLVAAVAMQTADTPCCRLLARIQVLALGFSERSVRTLKRPPETICLLRRVTHVSNLRRTLGVQTVFSPVSLLMLEATSWAGPLPESSLAMFVVQTGKKINRILSFVGRELIVGSVVVPPGYQKCKVDMSRW